MMHSATDIASASNLNLALQQGLISNLGSQQQQQQSTFDSSRTPPLSFTPSLFASTLHTPVSPNALSQSPRVNSPLTNQLSPPAPSPKSCLSSPRESTLSQNPLLRIQNQLSFSSQSPRTSPLSQDPVSLLSPSSSLPSLDSSSSLSVTSPTVSTPSTLSPAAPQFQLKPRLLDAPIDIHNLSLVNSARELDGRTRSTSGGISGSDVLNLTAALLSEGPSKSP